MAYVVAPIEVKASYPIRFVSTTAEVTVIDPKGAESTYTTPFVIEVPSEGTYSMKARKDGRELTTEFIYPEKKNVNFLYTFLGFRDKALVS